QVQNAMSAVTRAVDAKLGWNRLAFAISLLIIAAASVTLFRLLREVEPDKVMAALAAMPPRTILIAAVLVAAGYVRLTFYECFSLRTIGRRQVPYRIAALASFTSYSIGHNILATVLMLRAVRV